MGTRLSAPGPQVKRFAAYVEGLATAAGHQDRQTPLKDYCKGLLLPGERKSIEPMAARLDPTRVQPMRQSLHHLVAKAPWSDEVMLEAVRSQVLPAMQTHGPVVAWIVDDTGFPKKGKHSVGVARQYCGQVGKQDNCRVAVSLSLATWSSSLPIGYRLYLPKEWAEDAERRKKTEVPEEVEFQTKPEIALDQIRAAVASEVARGVVLADAAYGINTGFREGLTELALQYVVGVQSTMTVWESGQQPLPAKRRGTKGRPPKLLQRSKEHQPVSVKQLALGLPGQAFQEITWREGTQRKLMDFSVTDSGRILFTYVLPVAPDRALVEATVFAPEPLDRAGLANELADAIGQRVRGAAFTILRSESGILPMGPVPHATRTKGTYIQAGLTAGGVRPGTGHAFQRIQKWAETCARQLGAGGPPIGHAADPWPMRAMDQILLAVLRARPDLAPTLFLTLFEKVDTARLIRFLSDRGTPADLAMVVSALPSSPFLRQLPAAFRSGYRGPKDASAA